MFIEISIVLLFDLVVPISQGGSNLSIAPLNPSYLFDGNFTLAFLYSIIIFIGFESTAVYRDEVKNPKTTIPRVTYIAVLFIGLFYAASAWMTITAFGNQEVIVAANADASNLFMNAMGAHVGKIGVDLTKGILILSAFASLLSLHNVLARYIYALSCSKAIPALFGRIHPRHLSPYTGSLTCTIGWVIATACSLNSNPTILYAQFGGVGTYAILILMSLTSLAIILYFVRLRAISMNTFWIPLGAFLGLSGFALLTTLNFQYLIDDEAGDGVWLQSLIVVIFCYGYGMAWLNITKQRQIAPNAA